MNVPRIGESERYYAIVCSAVKLALRASNLDID